MYLCLAQNVIELHNIARDVEKKFHDDVLAKEIRECADKLNALLTQVMEKEKQKVM